MIKLHPIVGAKVKSTRRASPALEFQAASDAPFCGRLATQAGAPVEPVSVEWAAAPGDLDVLLAQGVRVLGQAVFAAAALEPPAAAVCETPVLARDPFMTLCGVSASGPSP